MTKMNSSKLIKFLFVFILVLSTSSCNDRNILSRDEMTSVLYDIQIAEAMYHTRQSDFMNIESKDALIAGILKKHDITQAQLDSSLVWYSDNVELYLKVNDSVLATLNRDLISHNDYINTRSNHRRAINYSVLPEFSYLNAQNSILTFEIDSFQIAHFPDLRIQFKTLWLRRGMDLDYTVSYVYRDTIIVEHQKIKTDSQFTMSKPKKEEPLRYMYGNVRLDIDKKKSNNKILLYDIVVRADSVKESQVDSLKVD